VVWEACEGRVEARMTGPVKAIFGIETSPLEVRMHGQVQIIMYRFIVIVIVTGY
jgi:hypothetical protein